MMPLSRCLPGIAILFSIATPAFACQQEQRRDAQAYPCDHHGKLEVSQDSRGFSINRRGPVPVDHAKPVTPTTPLVSIGATQKIDKTILLSGPGHSAETPDADR